MPPPSKSKPWLSWGECVAMCRDAGVSRKKFINLATATDPEKQQPLLKSKLFPGSKRKVYSRASLQELLQDRP